MTFADGEQYTGRFDLERRHGTSGVSIERQMVDNLRFHAGEYCPPHVDRKRYEDLVATYPVEKREGCSSWLRTYDFGGEV